MALEGHIARTKGVRL